jgi:D-alanyl-D-alanine dipeptidase
VKDEKAALTEKMAKAELYKTKAEDSVTVIADLQAKINRASVAEIREKLEKDLKKAQADKKKYEGIKANADKEFAAKKAADDALVLKENEENDK